MNAEDMLPMIKKAEGYPTSDTISQPDPRGGRGGAVGVNQVMPDTARQYGFDPARLHENDYNDTVAKFVVSDLHSKFGADDPKATLIGYNAGPGAVEKWQASGRNDATLPAQTQEYIRRAGLPVRVAQNDAVPNGQPQADFAAAQSRASDQGIDAQWNALLAPEKPPTGQQPTQPATAPTSYVNPNTPFGVQVGNFADNFVRSAKTAMADASIPQAPANIAGAAGARYLGGITGAWSKLKGDFDSYLQSVGAGPETANLPIWGRLQKEFEQTVKAGKLPVDAFNLAVSPISSAIDTALRGATQGIGAATGLSQQDRDKLNDDISKNLWALGPKGGLKRAIAEGTEAAEVAGTAPPKPASAPAETTPQPAAATPQPKAPEASVQPQETKPDSYWQERGLPPDNRDTSIDPTTGEKWDPNMPQSARMARILRAFPGLQQQPFEAATAATGAEARPEPSFTFGNEDRIEPTDADRANAAKFLNGEEPDNPVRIAMDRLITPETRNQAVNDIAKIIPIDQVKPVDVTMMNAYALQMSPDEVMASIHPQFPTDEKYYAAGMVLNSAAKQSWEAARAFAESGTPEDYEKAVRAYSLTNKYLGDLRSAKTDWGRAGRIQQELTTDSLHYTRAIQAAIDDVGSDNMEDAIRKIGSLDDPQKAAAMMSSMRRFTGRDGVLYGWYNILLSNPRTVLKKLTSDAVMATWNVTARYAGEKAGIGGGAINPGQASQLGYGYFEGMGDGIRAAGKALKAGSSQFQSEYQTVEGINKGRLSQLANGFQPNAPPSVPSDTMNFLRSAMPTSWIGAADDFAKVTNYRAELRSLAFAKATEDAAQNSGVNSAQRMQEYMNTPPVDMHSEAVSRSLANSFQSPLTGNTETFRNFFDGLEIPLRGTDFKFPIGRVLMPMIRLPANVMSYAYRNSPVPLAFPTQGYLDELRAGGAKAAIARTRVGLGTAALGVGVPLALSGMVTGNGPSDPQLRRAWMDAGNQPYSIRDPVSGKQYSYRSIEPIGFMLGAIADTVDIARFAKQQDTESSIESAAFGIGNALLNATYLSGLSDFLDALHDPNQEGSHWVENLVSTIAAPPIVSGAAQAVDPWRRAHYGLLEAIEARTPFLSERLPPQRTWLGDAIPWRDGFLPIVQDLPGGSGLARAISPIQVGAGASAAEPINKWIFDHRMDFPNAAQDQTGLTKVPRVVTYSPQRGVTARVQLTDAQYDRYQVLAGNGLKDPKTGLGFKDYMNALVQGRNPDTTTQSAWDNATDPERAVVTQALWSRFKYGRFDQKGLGGATGQLVQEYSDVKEALDAGLKSRAGQLTAQAQ